MKKPLLTVLTPTYNRSTELNELYKSLKEQKSDNLIWIIIDDGSTDNTKHQIQKFINDENKKFKIKYFYKKNEGKHTAINYSLKLLSTPLTIIIDSDDKLLPNGIKYIEYYWKKYKNYDLNTITFEHLYDDGKPMVKIKKSDLFENRFLYPIKYKLLGDYSDVFITSHLIKFSLPVFKGEKFLSEAPLYYESSFERKSVFINIPLTKGSYREDGLTKSIRRLQVKNYHGAMYVAKLSMSKGIPFWFKIKNATLYDYLAIKNKLSIFKAIKNSNHILLTGVSLILAYGYIILGDKVTNEND